MHHHLLPWQTVCNVALGCRSFVTASTCRSTESWDWASRALRLSLATVLYSTWGGWTKAPHCAGWKGGQKLTQRLELDAIARFLWVLLFFSFNLHQNTTWTSQTHPPVHQHATISFAQHDIILLPAQPHASPEIIWNVSGWEEQLPKNLTVSNHSKNQKKMKQRVDFSGRSEWVFTANGKPRDRYSWCEMKEENNYEIIQL